MRAAIGVAGCLAMPLFAANILPSLEILSAQPNLANTCNGNPFDLNVFIFSNAQTSAEVRVSAPVTGTLEQFTDPVGTNLPNGFNGVFGNYAILSFPSVAANTPVTIQITTYRGAGLSGGSSYTSTLVYNCTSGAILSLAPAPQIPTLSEGALAAMAALIALIGFASISRRGNRRASARLRRLR